MGDLTIYLQKVSIALQIQYLLSQLSALEGKHSCPDPETLQMLKEQGDFWSDWETAVRTLCDKSSRRLDGE